MKRRRLEPRIDESENLEDFSDDIIEGDREVQEDEDDGQDEEEYRGEKKRKPRNNKKKPVREAPQVPVVPMADEGDLVKSDNEA